MHENANKRKGVSGVVATTNISMESHKLAAIESRGILCNGQMENFSECKAF